MFTSFQSVTEQILLFTLDEQLYALFLQDVVKVIHAVEIRHLPKAPEIISGIINVQGKIIPIINIRNRFGLAERKPDSDDRIIIADTGKRQIAFLADTVTDIKDLSTSQFADLKTTLPSAEYIKGVAKIENELIVIYDLEDFLSLHEEKELDKAIIAKIK
jgi:purine-binding chemotaxis protein CheW